MARSPVFRTHVTERPPDDTMPVPQIINFALPPSASPGQIVNATVITKNNGPTGTVKVSLFHGSNLLASTQSGVIPQGQSSTRGFQFGAPGSGVVTIRADAVPVNADGEEGTTVSRSETMTVSSSGNVTSVGKVTELIAPQQAPVGASSVVSGKYKNVGPARDRITLRIYDNNVLMGFQSQELEPNDEVPFSISWTPQTVGQHTIKAEALGRQDGIDHLDDVVIRTVQVV